MKKTLIILLTIAILAILSSYIFVPSKIKISTVATGHTSIDAANRFLLDDINWEKWWPGSKPFYTNGTNFILSKKMFNIFELGIPDNNDTIKTYLQLLPGGRDSTGYHWYSEIDAGNDPITKWRRYFKATRLKKSFDLLVDSLKEKFEQEKIIYGFEVKRVKVVDSVLLSTRNQFDHYPDEKEIDTMIRHLRKYISDLNSVEKNYPMLNVYPIGKNDYEAMVAIPTERALPPSGSMNPKVVLKGGNLLETEIRGGPWTIRKAFEQFENYRSDFRFISPAIPYQQIITDRVKETDTTKWITKLYYPVF